MKIGYARVSTAEQCLDLQRAQLINDGCVQIFEDVCSGGQKHRNGLRNLLNTIKRGDTLVVWKLDRLGRSVLHLLELIVCLEKRGVSFRSLTDSIDTSTASGRFFFNVMASLAQMERELISERTMAGLATARILGRVGGRKSKMNDRKIELAKELYSKGVTMPQIASDLGVSLKTLYRWMPISKL